MKFHGLAINFNEQRFEDALVGAQGDIQTRAGFSGGVQVFFFKFFDQLFGLFHALSQLSFNDYARFFIQPAFHGQGLGFFQAALHQASLYFHLGFRRNSQHFKDRFINGRFNHVQGVARQGLLRGVGNAAAGGKGNS